MLDESFSLFSTNLLLFVMWWIHWLFCNDQKSWKKFLSKKNNQIFLTTTGITIIQNPKLWIKIGFYFSWENLGWNCGKVGKIKCLEIFPLGFLPRSIGFGWNKIKNIFSQPTKPGKFVYLIKTLIIKDWLYLNLINTLSNLVK